MSPHHHRPAHPTIRVTSRPRPVVHDEQLMMPQATLRRGDRTILILGTIHHAHQAFYDQLATTLAQLGYAVRYELIALIDPTPAVAEVLQPAGPGGGQGSLNIHAYRNRLFAALGLADQRHDLTYPGSARNVDLDINQVAELLGPKRFHKFARPKPVAEVTPQALRATRWGLRQMGGRTFLLASTLLTFRNRTTMMATRNRLAVDDALELADQGMDVALVWGAGHLPGQIRLLRRAGFHLVDVEHRPAIALNDLTTDVEPPR